MRALVQEACQGPVRDAVAMHAEKLATLSEADLRPLNIRDFQVSTSAHDAAAPLGKQEPAQSGCPSHAWRMAIHGCELCNVKIFPCKEGLAVWMMAMLGGQRSRLQELAVSAIAAQVAARAQRASVEPSEIVRYEEYDARHGARYADQPGGGDNMDEDEW